MEIVANYVPEYIWQGMGMKPNFQPKKNVTRLQKDLALLPLWLKDNCLVLQSDTDTYWHDMIEIGRASCRERV